MYLFPCALLSCFHFTQSLQKLCCGWCDWCHRSDALQLRSLDTSTHSERMEHCVQTSDWCCKKLSGCRFKVKMFNINIFQCDFQFKYWTFSPSVLTRTRSQRRSRQSVSPWVSSLCRRMTVLHLQQMSWIFCCCSRDHHPSGPPWPAGSFCRPPRPDLRFKPSGPDRSEVYIWNGSADFSGNWNRSLCRGKIPQKQTPSVNPAKKLCLIYLQLFVLCFVLGLSVSQFHISLNLKFSWFFYSVNTLMQLEQLCYL